MVTSGMRMGDLVSGNPLSDWSIFLTVNVTFSPSRFEDTALRILFRFVDATFVLRMLLPIKANDRSFFSNHNLFSLMSITFCREKIEIAGKVRQILDFRMDYIKRNFRQFSTMAFWKTAYSA